MRLPRLAHAMRVGDGFLEERTSREVDGFGTRPLTDL